MTIGTLTSRDRVLRATADLLAEGGREAVSTRAVATAAGVQAPTLYRLFGDKEGLLDAVAAYGFEEYLTGKRSLESTGDPVADLRRGWDLHVGFGLSRPAFYTLMYGDARPAGRSPAARDAIGILHGMVSRIAAAGRLRTDVDRAVGMVHAAGVGVTLALIATPPAERDPHLSTLTRDAILRTVTTDAEHPADPVAVTVAVRAQALRAALPDATALTVAERALLDEWLARLGDTLDETPGGTTDGTGDETAAETLGHTPGG